MKKFGIILGGFLLSFSGGAAYSWGVFTVPLMELFEWNKFEANISFTVFMMVFAVCMLPAGMAADRFGYRFVSRIGSFLLLPAYLLASLVGAVGHSWWLPLTHGLIGGIGCACVYSVIAPAIRSHFKKNTSLAVSAAVMGFGLASVFIAPIKVKFLIPGLGISGTLVVMGIMVFIGSFTGSFLMPDKNINENKIIIIPAKVVKDALSNYKFYLLWFIFASFVVGGFLSIGLFPSYARLNITSEPEFSAFVVLLFSGVNGFGRPLAGYLSEKIGYSKIIVTSGFVQFIFLLMLGLLPPSGNLLIMVSVVTGWSFAVILGLYPSFTSSILGNENLGTKYGMVFTGFGLGAMALLGGSFLYDLSGSFSTAFISAALASFVSVILIFLLMYLRKRQSRGEA
ncbi:MAG TPA: MFS transporter [Spirochaetota bacterium]|jgi:OFA family oxalate/formate antiporter-like MFS transporter|nr:MFS transporter [Spirochaetota bacterium]HPY02843.1 MFS transporter [Spirochaetota bacterium]